MRTLTAGPVEGPRDDGAAEKAVPLEPGETELAPVRRTTGGAIAAMKGSVDRVSL